jgi:beta-glucosidase
VNNEETIRLGGSATVDERSFREYYLPVFKSLIVEGGARSVMAAYNGINDVPCQANKMLLTDILKTEWGFGGYAITDGEGTGFLVSQHQYVSTHQEAVARSIKAGCDIDLSSGFYYLNNLQTAVNQGLITEQEVTTALTRFLKVRFELGEFDPPAAVPYTSISGSINNCQAHRDLALSIARKSIVLLKNQDNFLPLHSDSVTSIAVIGPFADTTVFGGYSGLQSNVTTAFEGIKTSAGSAVNVSYKKAYNIGGTNFDNAAVTLAQNSDIAILCIGEEVSRFSGINGCGGETYDRPSLDLPKVAVDLAKAVSRVNPKTIVVLFNSEPWAITWINDSIPAIVEAWYTGQDQGKAIADVLFGDYNPGGKLPVTFHTSISQLPPMDDYDITKGRTYKYFTGKPLYPFGYGLSYTTFAYSNLRITPTTIGKDGEATITFDVKNTGDRAGDEVVQLYVHDIEASVKRPSKELKGFQRVTLQPGETKTVTLKLNTEVLAFWDVNDDKFVVEPGYFDIMIGSSSEDIRLRDTIYATDQSVAIHPGVKVSHKNYFNFRIAIKKPGSVTIIYTINARQQKEKEPLLLDIYNSLGKRIFHTALPKRSTKYSWSGITTTGLPAGKGVFYFKLTYKGTSEILKGIIVK